MVQSSISLVLQWGAIGRHAENYPTHAQAELTPFVLDPMLKWIDLLWLVGGWEQLSVSLSLLFHGVSLGWPSSFLVVWWMLVVGDVCIESSEMDNLPHKSIHAT